MKRGISPLISTVLIVGLVIVVVALIIVWGTDLLRSNIEETTILRDIEFQAVQGTKIYITSVERQTASSFELNVENKGQNNIKGVVLTAKTGDGVKTGKFYFTNELTPFHVETAEIYFGGELICNVGWFTVYPIVEIAGREKVADNAKLTIKGSSLTPC